MAGVTDWEFHNLHFQAVFGRPLELFEVSVTTWDCLRGDRMPMPVSQMMSDGGLRRRLAGSFIQSSWSVATRRYCPVLQKCIIYLGSLPVFWPPRSARKPQIGHVPVQYVYFAAQKPVGRNLWFSAFFLCSRRAGCARGTMHPRPSRPAPALPSHPATQRHAFRKIPAQADLNGHLRLRAGCIFWPPVRAGPS